MPEYEVVERHHIRVKAPAETTLAAAAETDLRESATVAALLQVRRFILGAGLTESGSPHSRGLLASMKAMGWGVLAEEQGREIVVGAVTQPWKANVVFRRLAPDEFAGFREPGYVKIAWTLRADPTGDAESIFRTETRAAATDAYARRRFRPYWSCFCPGIVLVRKSLLRLVRREAENRAFEHKAADAHPGADQG
jgi:hypothetical protein